MKMCTVSTEPPTILLSERVVKEEQLSQGSRGMLCGFLGVCNAWPNSEF